MPLVPYFMEASHARVQARLCLCACTEVKTARRHSKGQLRGARSPAEPSKTAARMRSLWVRCGAAPSKRQVFSPVCKGSSSVTPGELFPLELRLRRCSFPSAVPKRRYKELLAQHARCLPAFFGFSLGGKFGT